MGTKHDTQNVFDMLGNDTTTDTTDTKKAEKRKKGRPKKSEEEKQRGYRYNLTLDKSVRRYIYNKAWQDRVSASEYINRLIEADMNAYYKNGGKENGWIDPPAEGKGK